MIELNQYKFKYEFRDYQKRALNEIHKYMADDKIHIVAAPGAGKTILALQLLVEINKNTLILVPTIALREQWIERFREDFAEGKDVSAVIGNDIEESKQITVITYQAMYSAYKTDALLLEKMLKQLELGLVILDEAHHLKSSWWKALDDIVRKLKEVKLISLTATPPYDVDNQEWKRYMELCGEIDAEITSPELVKKGSLCPHQDYIYFNFPSEKQLIEIESYYEKRDALFQELCGSRELVTAISLHPVCVGLEDHIEFFLEEFEYYLAIQSFLKYKGVPIENEVFGKRMNIPPFDMRCMEVLLSNCLFTDKKSYLDFSGFFREVRRKLNEIGAIHDSKVTLVANHETKRLITQNIGKLNSINEIAQIEYEAMHDQMKMVVITDYILADVYEVLEETEINVIGVIPIFRSMIANVKEEINVAVLTGSVVIIPTMMKEELLRICEERGIGEIVITELAYAFDYCRVAVSEKRRKHIVSIITELFKRYPIHVLIGTTALIGEGWDAPFVNSLIMATFVSSFVTSNQIRGRAIRINKNDADKTANIWHLVCVEKVNNDSYRFGVDYDILKRRFDTFEGIYLDEEKIDRSIYRLNIEEEKNVSMREINVINNHMVKIATNRSKMKGQWESALVNYVPIKIGRVPKQKNSSMNRQYKRTTIKAITRDVGIAMILYGAASMRFGVGNIILNSALIGVVAISGILNWARGKKINIVKKLGNALLTSLVDIGLIENANAAKVIVKQEKKDIIFYIDEGSVVEKTRFNNCLYEMLEPIDVPRYVVEINGIHYQVPAIIGKNRKWVDVLERNLKRAFWKVKVTYTKSPNGKMELMKIKIQSLTKQRRKQNAK